MANKSVFCVILVSIVMLSLIILPTSCVRQGSAGVGKNYGEITLFSTECEDCVPILYNEVGLRYNANIGSYEYKYQHIVCKIYPLKLSCERQNVGIIYNDREYTYPPFGGGGEIILDGEVIGSETLILIVGELREELCLENYMTVSVDKIIRPLRKLCKKRGYAEGDVKVCPVWNFERLYVFGGFYKDDVLRCAVLIDEKGDLLAEL